MRRAGWLLLVLGLLAAPPQVRTAEKDKGPPELKIDSNGKDRAVPVFTHLKHLDLEGVGECSACHHTWKAGEQVKRCGVCHTLAKETDPVTGGIGFKPAFHQQCRECHRKSAKQLTRPELKKCTTCHGK